MSRRRDPYAPAPPTLFGVCSSCGRGPLAWADGRLVCPHAHCRGHDPDATPKKEPER